MCVAVCFVLDTQLILLCVCVKGESCVCVCVSALFEVVVCVYTYLLLIGEAVSIAALEGILWQCEHHTS